MSQDKKPVTPTQPEKSREDEAREVAREYADQQRQVIDKLRKRDGHAGEGRVIAGSAGQDTAVLSCRERRTMQRYS
ncbi:hypothetical protein JQ625_01350 [Bradyrhizobium diazoefficiens]|nr:hypothetical protein [Bradyrhizobium diazoefficiens]MBR0773467.1 hypothetical protein [Bradyrhizobium diazoefficiens]